MIAVLYCLPLVLGIWGGIFLLLSWSGGWSAVARRYRTAGPPAGTRLRLQSARFGWVDYNGCLTIVVAPDGLYVAALPIFRIGHPPLLIPWSALSVLAVKEGRWFGRAKLAIDAPPIARIEVPLTVIEAANALRGRSDWPDAAGNEAMGPAGAFPPHRAGHF